MAKGLVITANEQGQIDLSSMDGDLAVSEAIALCSAALEHFRVLQVRDMVKNALAQEREQRDAIERQIAALAPDLSEIEAEPANVNGAPNSS